MGALPLTKLDNLLGGIKLDIASMLETNAILNARASPIIEHASSKFKLFNFKFMLINFSSQFSYMIILLFNHGNVIINSFNINSSTSSANGNMLDSRCRGFASI
jgi:hypothetical protein